MPSSSVPARPARPAAPRALRSWLGVNGGVLLCALLSHAASTLAGDSRRVLAAVLGTAVLYAAVFAAAFSNLRGRRRIHERSDAKAARVPPVALLDVIYHPLGSAIERVVHERYLAASPSLWTSSPFGLVGGCAWCASLFARLFLFELVFDGLFYAAHRLAHTSWLYPRIHKLHHRHTHDVWLLSSLQMSGADVVLTHTLPVLGALTLVPMAAGVEICIVKTYLLFQELYGHAGVTHRGRNFGPAPFLVQWLGIELRAEDHQRHHIKASCNFSKRFSFFDKVFGTWDDGRKAAKYA